MRTTELEAQIQDIEAKLAKLSGPHVGEVWVLTPIGHQPAPPQSVIDHWMQALGLGHVTALPVPSRHKAVTAVVVTPGHDGAPQPDGWTLVALDDVAPGFRDSASTAWHHPLLAQLYRDHIDNRCGRVDMSAMPYTSPIKI